MAPRPQPCPGNRFSQQHHGNRFSQPHYGNRLCWRKYGMEVSTEKSKVMTNSTNQCRHCISMNGQKLEKVTSFKYQGASLCEDDTCSAEIRIRIASTMAAIARLNRICLFRKQVYVVQVSCQLHSPPWLWNMDPACWLWKKDPGFRKQVHEKTSPHLLLGSQDQQLGEEHNQLPCGSRGTSSGNCQETETCVVWASHMPRQPLQNHSSGHHGGWTALWSAEEMLDGQHSRVNVPAHTKTVHNGLLQKRLEENICWFVCHVPPTTQSTKGLDWTELPHTPALFITQTARHKIAGPPLRIPLENKNKHTHSWNFPLEEFW